MKKLFLVFVFIAFSINSFSQVGIGTVTPDASSQLDVTATDKGILIPQVPLGDVTDTMLDGINTAATGLLIYNTNAATTGGSGVGYYYFNGTIWVRLANSVAASDDDWYEENTTNSPDDITDDMFTQGNIALGKTDAVYRIDVLDDGFRSLNILNNGTIDGTIYGIAVQNENTGIGDHIGTYNYLTGVSTGQQVGVSNSIINTGDGTHNGVSNSLTGTGNGTQHGVFTGIANAGTGWHIGLRNNLSGSSATGNSDGIYNNITRGGSGIINGVRNDITNASSTGSKTGIANTITGSGSTKIGLSNTISGTSTGTQQGVNNILSTASNVIQYGTNNGITAESGNNSNTFGNLNTVGGDGDGNHYGVSNSLSGNGNGNQYGVNNDIGTIGFGFHYGVYNNLSSNSTNVRYGTYNLIGGNDTSGLSVKYGSFQEITTTGNAPHYGSVNRLSGSGDGEQYGVSNQIINDGIGNQYGTYTELTGVGSGAHYGSSNLLTDGGTGLQYGFHTRNNSSGDATHYGFYGTLNGIGSGEHNGLWIGLSGTGQGNQRGVYSNITNAGNGDHYGVESYLSGGGSGDKYSSHNTIASTAGGTHYGVYSDVQKVGSFAGYFNGRVELVSTTDASGTTGTGVLEIANTLRLDGNEIITDSNTRLHLQYDNNGDFSVDNTTLYVDSSVDNVGVGTTAPGYALDVASGRMRLRNNVNTAGIWYSEGTNDRQFAGAHTHSSTGTNQKWGVWNNAAWRFVVQGNGRVGIGTAAPGYALDVVGDINTSGNIRQSGGAYTFPDYVFESYYEGFSEYNLDYKLKSLSEVELFLKENKHLPGVQNRVDVKSKGWNITEGVRTNLEKIEELYLYTIEANKTINQLSKENENLKAQLEAQQKEINEIKALLNKQ